MEKYIGIEREGSMASYVIGIGFDAQPIVASHTIDGDYREMEDELEQMEETEV